MHWTRDIALLSHQEEVARQNGGPYGARCVPIERDAMPSSYVCAAVVNGEPGATPRLMWVTLVRAAFMVPAVWATARIRDIEELDSAANIAAFALGTSIAQSISLIGLYAYKARRWERVG